MSTVTLAPAATGAAHVVLATDSAMFSTGLSGILADEPAIASVAIAGSAEELPDLLRHTDSVVVLAPGFFGHLDPVRAVSGLARCPRTRTIVLAARASEQFHLDLVAAGCAGTFPLRRSVRDLAAAIVIVARGERLAFDARHLMSRATFRALEFGLSRREHEVLELMVDGCTNRKIAERLFVSTHTARHHVQSILEKLGTHSRVEAAAVAIRQQLVDR